MLYTDDSWTYNRQMYKTYERECLRDKRLRVIDTFQLDLFLPVAYRVQRTQQTWPVSKPPFPPPPLSRFFLIIYVARYVHFSSFRF